MNARVLHLVPRQPIPHPAAAAIALSREALLSARCCYLRAERDALNARVIQLEIEATNRSAPAPPRRADRGAVVLAAIVGFMVAVLMRRLGW